MQKIKAYLNLCRPMTSLAGSLAVVLGGYVAGTGEWRNIFLAALATLLSTGSSNAWNDCLDIEIDRVNKPQRALPSGRITVREAWIFSLCLSGIAVLLGALISPLAFVVILGCNALLYLYSWKLKSTVLFGNATIATISGTTAILGGVAAGNILPVLSIALIIAIVNLAREVLKTMADYEGDISQQVRTIATVWGQKKARILFVGILSFGFFILLLPYLLDQFALAYVIILAIGIYPVLVYVLLQARSNAPAAKLDKLATLLKYDFFIWFAAVFAGAAV